MAFTPSAFTLEEGSMLSFVSTMMAKVASSVTVNHEPGIERELQNLRFISSSWLSRDVILIKNPRSIKLNSSDPGAPTNLPLASCPGDKIPGACTPDVSMMCNSPSLPLPALAYP
jgi:hypothetical protein